MNSFYEAMLSLFCCLVLIFLTIILIVQKKGRDEAIDKVKKETSELAGRIDIQLEEDKKIKKEILDCLERINNKIS